jgi:hypothetical protein
LWRLLHLPLFAVTVIAAGAHIYSVWGMEPSGEAASAVAATTTIVPAKTKIVPVPVPAASPPKRTPTASAPVAKPVPQPVLQPAPPIPQPTPAPAAAAPPADEPQLIAKPKIVPRPGGDNRNNDILEKQAEANRAEAPRGPPPAKAPSVTAGPAAQAVAEPPALRTEVKGADVSLPLAQRLAAFKADRAFDHDRTRFPLLGKHKKVDCAECHTKTIEKTPSTCVSCHKKDDVHRGRRPVCETCHNANSWTPIKKQ